MFKHFIIICFLLFGLTGCATPQYSSKNIDPYETVKEFDKKWSKKFTLIETVCFDIRGEKISGIGYIFVDRIEKTFTLSVMNQLGIKIFEISADKDRILSSFAIQDISDMGDFAVAITEDIRRIYFGVIPSPDAVITDRRGLLVFTERNESYRAEYFFDMSKKVLFGKRYFSKRKLYWETYYSDYLLHGDFILPGKIIFKNHQFGYIIAVKLKEVKV